MANGIGKAIAKEEKHSERFEEIRQMIVLHFQQQVGLSNRDARKLADKMVKIAEQSHIEARNIKL